MKTTLLLFLNLCLTLMMQAQVSKTIERGQEARVLNSEESLTAERKAPVHDSWETRKRVKTEKQSVSLKSVSIVSKTVNVSAGGLSSALTATEKTTVTNLVISGTIDARDFKTMRDNMPVLTVLDLSKVSIAAFTGNGGTADTTSYPANYIPTCAFYEKNHVVNKTLTNIVFPASLKGVDKYAFCYCSGLTGTLNLPSSVTCVERSAFNSTGFTGKLSLPQNLSTIGRCAFYNCSGFTGGLVIPSQVDSIGDLSFAYCTGFTGSLTIPNSVTTILESAFDGCSGFTGSLAIPNSVKKIENFAFWGCSGFTGAITIPASVQSIGIGVFTGYNGLITVDEKNLNYSSLNGILYNKDKSALIQCPVSKKGNISIPATVKEIGVYAFYGCLGLTGSLIIPSNLEKIGSCGFYGCTGFTGSLTLPSTIDSIGDYAFRGCSGLTGILTIPSSVTSIEKYTFYGCSGFTGLTLPASLTTIGKYCFLKCTGLKGSLTIPDKVTEIGDFAFEECSGFNGFLKIGSSVKKIGNAAFQRCSSFTGELTIPSSIDTIEDFAFAVCEDMTGQLTIPNSVSFIGRNAFGNCSGFTGLVLPSTETFIGENCFYKCTSLVKIVAKSTTPFELSSSAEVFEDVDKNNCTLYIPAGSKNAYQFADQWGDFMNIVEEGNLLVSASNVKIDATEGSIATVNVTSALSWTTSSDQSWLTVSPASGKGNGTIKFTAKANKASSIRTAKVTLSATGETPQTIIVNQASGTWNQLSDIIVTFKPSDVGATIDSVVVINQNTNQTVRMAGNETLTLSAKTNDINTLHDNAGQGKLFPNPCDGLSSLSFVTDKKEKVNIRVSNTSGQMSTSFVQDLDEGVHNFSLQLPGSGIFFVTIQKSSGPLSFKVISTGKGMQNSTLSHIGSKPALVADQMKSTMAGKMLGYTDGNNILYTVYSGNNITVIADSPIESTIYDVAFYPCADREGRNYKTLKLGTQVWMAENLAYLPKVGPSTEYSYSENYYYVCGYPGTSLSEAKATDDYKIYGVLYNWPAANNSCPAGWHLPSDSEWTTLEVFLQNNGYNYDGSIYTSKGHITKNKLAKSLGATSGWELYEEDIDVYEGALGIDQARNNSSGFNAFPGGGFFESIIDYGGFVGGGFGTWWSSTEIGSSSAFNRDMIRTSSELGRTTDYNKGDGFSVRCVKN